MRRMLIALLAVVAMVASMIGLSVGMAAPASAIETISVTPSPYLDAAAPLDVTINGFPTMVLNNYYVYFLDFNNMTGSNTGNVCPTFALVGGAGTPTPNGSPGANVANPTLPACEWVSGTRFRFVYSDATGLNATSQVKITFPALTVAPPASGQYNVIFTAGALGQYPLDSICIGNCPTGYVAPVAPAVITIDFDGNGGTCSTTKVTGYATTWANAPTDSVCTRDGYLLGSFNTSADGSGLTIPVGGNLNLTGDNRIYAQWLSPDAPIRTPGAPTDVVATSLWNRVQVNWTAPSDQGTTPVLNYLVNAHPGAKVCITSVVKDKKPTQCSFNGQLTAGTKYTFTVSALNFGGWGDASSASAPASPQSLGITSYKRSKVFLSFDSKVDVGGIAPGYPARTKVTPWVKVGDTGTWVAQKGSLATVNASGKFGWGARFKRNAASQAIYVKFTVDGTNFSNIVQIRPSGASTSVKQINIVRKDREIAPNGRQYLVATAQTHGFKKEERLAVWLKWGSGTFAKSPGSLKVAADGTVGLRIPVATRNRSESVTFYIASQNDEVKSNVVTESAR